MTEQTASLGFGLHETDQVYVADGIASGDAGNDVTWQAGQFVPFAPLEISPAAAVLSYGLGVFEGLKVQRGPDGKLRAFRLQSHAERFQRSAGALLMPPFPVSRFGEACRELVRRNVRHIPESAQGSLYIRAMQFASGAKLGHGVCREFRVVIYCSPVGSFFAAGEEGLRLRVLDQARVAADSTGWAKAIGNYAGALAVATRWQQQGYHDVLFLDARHVRYVTETGGANVFAVLKDGAIVTPHLDDQILPGITRDSVLALLRAQGNTVEERDLGIDEVMQDGEEMFCAGTAWTLRSVSELDHAGTVTRFASQRVREPLLDELEAIKRGTRPDPQGWLTEIEV